MIFLQLEDSVIRNFAKAVTNSNDFTETSGVLYGTVKKNDSDTYVVLDGSNLETPVVTAMDAEDGDRVMVSIVNHVATITGNITSPASARTASSYMKLTDEGLIVGRLDGIDLLSRVFNKAFPRHQANQVSAAIHQRGIPHIKRNALYPFYLRQRPHNGGAA